MKPLEKLSKGLTGIAGEYFVAGELSRRGIMASITLRNNDSIDIHASSGDGKHLVAIQVKTNQTGRRSWALGAKSETLKAVNLYYIFVALKGENERADYFIVPSEIVAKRIKAVHTKWLNTPGKKGQAHKDNSIRTFFDDSGEFLERWDLLSLND